MTSKKSKKGAPGARNGAGSGQESLLRRILNAEERPAVARKIEWAIFAVMCLAAFYLNIVLYRHSGGFWRDEASTIYVAAAPSLSDMWTRMSKDSCPVLLCSSVRAWIAAGFGASDDGIRFFGTLVSLGIVVSLAASCWAFTARVPLLAMSLVVLNGSVFYYCSSLRAYGLAVLFIMPCCAAFWRLAAQPSRWSISPASLWRFSLAMPVIRISYLLLAIGLAGAGVCACCRLWKRSILILAICFAAAVSLLIYVPVIRGYHDVSEMMGTILDLPAFGRGLAEAVSFRSDVLLSVWILLALCAIVCLIIQVVRRGGFVLTGPSQPLYLLIMAIVAVGAAAGFFTTHRITPFPWHYTPLIALAGMIAEVAFQSPHRRGWVWVGRVTCACVVLAWSIPLLWGASHLRRTNLDRIDSVLAERAGDNDLILVNPFWLAPGFQYHYRGHARWRALPLTSADPETSFAVFDAIRQSMATPDAIGPTLKEVEQTLSAGHRLWIVGTVEFLPPNVAPPRLPPAPQASSGWNCVPYYRMWSMQLGGFLQSHAVRGEAVPVPIDQQVSELENQPLMMLEGWRVGDRVMAMPSGDVPNAGRSTKERP